MILTMAGVTALAAPALADDAADAQAMFSAGVAALEQSDADAARVAFERSLELHPTSAAAFNLAGVLSDLGQPSAACTLYEELRRGVYGSLTDEQSREVERLAAEAEAMSAHIEVRVVAPSAVRITIGDHQGLALESEPLVHRVDPGVHHVRGELEGAPMVENDVEVRAGGRGRTLLRFQMALMPTEVPTDVNEAQGSDESVVMADEPRRRRPWLWVVVGLVLVGGATAAIVLATRPSSGNDEIGTVLPATGTLLSF